MAISDLSVSYGRPPQLIEAEVPANVSAPHYYTYDRGY